jgi:vacuolar-type H+-ATPase subunit F/Vma7
MRALLTIVICVLWATAGQAQTRVTVFLTAGVESPDVIVPEDYKACLAATEDVRKALAGKKGIRIVESPDQARVTVSVYSCRRDTRGNFRPSDLTDVNAATVHAVRAILGVNGSGYAILLVGVTDGSIKRRAAEKLANQIDRWVKDNEEYLPSIVLAPDRRLQLNRARNDYRSARRHHTP